MTRRVIKPQAQIAELEKQLAAIDINLAQAKKLVKTFGGDEEVRMTLVKGDDSFYRGPGLYSKHEYPDCGFCVFLGKGNEDEVKK